MNLNKADILLFPKSAYVGQSTVICEKCRRESYHTVPQIELIDNEYLTNGEWTTAHQLPNINSRYGEGEAIHPVEIYKSVTKIRVSSCCKFCNPDAFIKTGNFSFHCQVNNISTVLTINTETDIVLVSMLGHPHLEFDLCNYIDNAANEKFMDWLENELCEILGMANITTNKHEARNDN